MTCHIIGRTLVAWTNKGMSYINMQKSNAIIAFYEILFPKKLIARVVSKGLYISGKCPFKFIVFRRHQELRGTENTPHRSIVDPAHIEFLTQTYLQQFYTKNTNFHNIHNYL